MKKYKVVTDKLTWYGIDDGDILERDITKQYNVYKGKEITMSVLNHNIMDNCIKQNPGWFEEVDEEYVTEEGLVRLLYPISAGRDKHKFCIESPHKGNALEILIPCEYLEEYIHESNWIKLKKKCDFYQSETFTLCCEIQKGTMLRTRKIKQKHNFTKEDMIDFGKMSVLKYHLTKIMYPELLDKDENIFDSLLDEWLKRK